MSKSKVAILIYGHLRTFLKCAPSLLDNIRKPLNADLFLHTWNELDSKTPSWYPEDWKIKNEDINIRDMVEEIYNPTSFQIDNPLINEEIKNKFLLDSNLEPRINLMGWFSQWSSFKRSSKLLTEFEKSCQENYDFIIVTRPDIYFNNSTTLFFKRNLQNVHENEICCNPISIDNFFINEFLFTRKTGFDTAFWGAKKSVLEFSKIIDYYDYLYLDKESMFSKKRSIGVFWPEVFSELYLNSRGISLQSFNLDIKILRKKDVIKKNKSTLFSKILKIFKKLRTGFRYV